MPTSVSSLLSATNSSTGLGQGIDVTQFVQLALAGDQANITALQNRQAALNSQSSALATINSDLNNLQSAAFALNDPLGALSAQSATSSNSGVLTAAAASTATPGTHSVTVNSLATTSSYYSDPVPGNSTLAAGTFNVSVGGAAPVTFTIDSTDNTLAGLAASINDQNAGVLASVISDANGSRLALVSQTTGAPGDLTVSANTTGLNFNKAVNGLSASLTVDGVPISSATNTVSGVINGVTLNLTAASPGNPVALTVAPDKTQTTNALNQFVSAYNTAINDINKQFAVAADGSGGGALEADGSLRETQQKLLSAISYSVTGNNGAVNLSSIGLGLNNDGTLSVDSGKLGTALAGNFSGVQNFLQSTTNGFASNLSSALSGLTSSGTGVLALDSLGISQSSRALSQQISDLQVALSTKQQNLVRVYAQVNVTLQQLPLLQSQISRQLGSF